MNKENKIDPRAVFQRLLDYRKKHTLTPHNSGKIKSIDDITRNLNTALALSKKRKRQEAKLYLDAS